MKKAIVYFTTMLLLISMLSACGSQTNSESLTTGSSVSKETELPTDYTNQLDQEEKYDKVFSYFSESGKSRHSITTEAKYIVGSSSENNCIYLIYISDDDTQGVLLSLYKNGRLEITVNIKSHNEAVIGTADINAADYIYGYEFKDFTYQSSQNDWGYENFTIRANTYIRDTLLYADGILQDYTGYGLQDIGFTSWINPGDFVTNENRRITADDIAGMWECKSNSSDEYSSRLYLIDDKIYWCGFEESYAEAITATVMTEGEDFLLSQSMTMSTQDYWTGERIITDVLVGNDDDVREKFRRYIYRDDDGNLCMRVESTCSGLSDSEDGKVYIKLDNDEKASISPSIYDPTAATSDQGEQSTYSEETTKNTEKSTLTTSENNSYQDILDEYTEKMEDTVSRLVAEYKSEVSGISDIEELAEICNEKVGDLAEICNEGIGKMAELMYEKGDSYDTYESWAGKLQDNYSEIASEIQDAYMESAMN